MFSWAGLEQWLLLISAPQVARITGMSHWYLTSFEFFMLSKCELRWIKDIGYENQKLRILKLLMYNLIRRAQIPFSFL
jgi:hypothetical protein